MSYRLLLNRLLLTFLSFILGYQLNTYINVQSSALSTLKVNSQASLWAVTRAFFIFRNIDQSVTFLIITILTEQFSSTCVCILLTDKEFIMINRRSFLNAAAASAASLAAGSAFANPRPSSLNLPLMWWTVTQSKPSGHLLARLRTSLIFS